jgi:hypothetical protein
MQRAYRLCRCGAGGTLRRRPRPRPDPNAAGTTRVSPAVGHARLARVMVENRRILEGERPQVALPRCNQSTVPVDQHQPAIGLDRVGCMRLAVSQHHSIGETGCGARETVVADEPIDEASGVTVDKLAGRFSVRPIGPSGRQVGDRGEQIIAMWNGEVVLQGVVTCGPGRLMQCHQQLDCGTPVSIRRVGAPLMRVSMYG